MATYFVTGAAKGIGRATVLRLDRAGHTVFAGIRSPKDGENLRNEASERLRPVQLDITVASQLHAAAATVAKAVGESGLDGLVNNAGIAVAAPIEFVPIDDFRRQIEINLTSQIAVTQAFLPLLRKARGRVVNITSIGGIIAGPMLGAYHASKFALEAVSDSLRQELAPWGMKVVAIEPGAIATPIWESGTASANAILEKMPAQGRELYAKAFDGARAFADHASKTGLPPDRVAKAIEHALQTRRPRPRYTVGIDAMIGVTVLAKLPDRLRDRLFASRR